MNPFVTPDCIYISKSPLDMRAGIQKIASLIVAEFERDPMDGSLYVFISRDCKKAKLIRFDSNGWCLYYCTLLKGGFKWSHTRDDKTLLIIERRQLLWFLEGLEIVQSKAIKPVTAHNVL